MTQPLDRKNTVVVSLCALLIALAIVAAVIVGLTQSGHTDREHIAACTHVTGNLERAICLGRQP